MQLNDKTILLTGAASGLGRELALQLDWAGSDLWLIDRDAAGLQTLCAALSRPAHSLICDLSQPAARTRLIARLNSTPVLRLHLIIHCAGIGSHSRLDQLTPEEVNQVLQVNTLAPLDLTAGLLSLLAGDEPGGLVIIGSIAGEMVTPGLSLYSTSKAALHAFSRAVAIELSAHKHFCLLVVLGALKDTRFANSIRHPTRGQPTWYRRLDAAPPLVARAILRAIQQERTLLFYPGWYRWVVSLSQLCTPLTRWVTRLGYRKLY
jgi:short-subunit dehydrogenase